MTTPGAEFLLQFGATPKLDTRILERIDGDNYGADVDYKIETVALEQDDLVLLYTDGLIDAMNFDRQLWGRERLFEVIKGHPDCTAEQLIGNIGRYRRRFSGLAKQIDDTSIVAIRLDKTSTGPKTKGSK